MDWTRRAFLKAGGVALLSLGVGGSPAFLGRTARLVAAPGPFGRRKTLVGIFQRGAMDGVMAVTPFRDQNLAQLRPRLNMSAAAAAGDEALLELDGRFALHPSLRPFLPLYKDGRLAIVHGVGSPDTTRSHFDAQDYMETGTPSVKGTPDGWLNRAVGLLGHEATPFQAVALTSAMPRSLYGDHPALAVGNLEDFKVQSPGGTRLSQLSGDTFESLYEQTSQELLRQTGQESFEAIEMLERLDLAGYQPANGAVYPNSPLGQSLRQIAMLIKADMGLEVAFAETGGWDTHVAQGTANGTFGRRARDLAQAMSAFWADLEAWQDDVVVLTMTEFGRTVHQNGSGGTDHGRGSAMFVLGNEVAGGQVHGTLPALAKENLEDGRDVPVTTDFRSVFSSLATGHLGVDAKAVSTLFPGWEGAPLPLLRQA